MSEVLGTTANQLVNSGNKHQPKISGRNQATLFNIKNGSLGHIQNPLLWKITRMFMITKWRRNIKFLVANRDYVDLHDGIPDSTLSTETTDFFGYSST